jgi:fumarylacetoacetase
MHALDRTHDPETRSWLESANTGDTDFPIQNLPFGVFRRAASEETMRGGVAIGDQVIDLQALASTEVLEGTARLAAYACAAPALNGLFELGPTAWRELRHALFDLLKEPSDKRTEAASRLRQCLVPQEDVVHGVPARIGDYTDFYTSIHHARTISGLLGLGGDLPPNFQWVPTAYHGRVSSIDVSGQRVRRPHGQVLKPGSKTPVYAPSERLDYELELGIYIGVSNDLGEAIDIADASAHVFGLSLLNDWSARDIQAWEIKPLGPFHAKNFATTVSPWIVTMDALAPFRMPWSRPAGDPQPLPYLADQGDRDFGAFDIQLEVAIETARQRGSGSKPSTVSRTSFRHHYWSIAQMVTHHAAGGCNLQSGDLLGSGTISGPGRSEAGALMELALAGKEPVPLDGGETRSFLADGDRVIFRGRCERPGRAAIGFGINHGEILPASTRLGRGSG